MSAVRPVAPPTMVLCALCQASGAATCPHGAARGLLDDGATLREDPMVAQRAQLGDYVVECKLGRGGMGDVYGARHPVIGKRVAIKVLAAETLTHPHAMERFIGEAQAVCAIGHPGIVDIFGFGKLDDGRAYFVMEWLTGATLRQRLDELGRGGARLPLADALAVIDAVAEALEAAHGAGVIHRDLKPDNMFLVATPGGGFRTKLLDFGIAKLSSSRGAEDRNRTGTGTVVGTPDYMSPEQARGDAIGPPSDVYSLGVVLYELLCGSCPFVDESSVVVMARHVTDEPPPPSRKAAGVRPDVEALVMAMLDKAPARRPTLAEVRRRLKTFAGGGAPMPVSPLAAASPDAAAFDLPLSMGALDVIALSDLTSPGADAAERRRSVGAAATVALPTPTPAPAVAHIAPQPSPLDLELPQARATPAPPPTTVVAPPIAVARTVTPRPIAAPVAGGVAVAPARGLPIGPLILLGVVLLGAAIWFFVLRDEPRRTPRSGRLRDDAAAPTAPPVPAGAIPGLPGLQQLPPGTTVEIYVGEP